MISSVSRLPVVSQPDRVPWHTAWNAQRGRTVYRL